MRAFSACKVMVCSPYVCVRVRGSSGNTSARTGFMLRLHGLGGFSDAKCNTTAYRASLALAHL